MRGSHFKTTTEKGATKGEEVRAMMNETSWHTREVFYNPDALATESIETSYLLFGRTFLVYAAQIF